MPELGAHLQEASPLRPAARPAEPQCLLEHAPRQADDHHLGWEGQLLLQFPQRHHARGVGAVALRGSRAQNTRGHTKASKINGEKRPSNTGVAVWPLEHRRNDSAQRSSPHPFKIYLLVSWPFCILPFYVLSTLMGAPLTTPTSAPSSALAAWQNSAPTVV